MSKNRNIWTRIKERLEHYDPPDGGYPGDAPTVKSIRKAIYEKHGSGDGGGFGTGV
jgi:hypothetical protein